MLRPFLSLLVAGGATAAGLAASWFAAATHPALVARVDFDPIGLALGVAAALLLGLAGLSIAIHWVGALVMGAIHGLLGLLALVQPGGPFSPVFQVTRMLSKIDLTLGDGAMMFYFSGTAFVVGAFLVGAALGIRSRRLAAPSSPKAVAISSAIGSAALLAASALLLVAGGAFVQQIAQLLRHDAVSGAIVVVAGCLSGVAGLLLRWSSFGVIASAAVVFVVGTVLFAAFVPLPAWFPGRLPATSGLLMTAGATFLAVAIAGAVRWRSDVPDDADAL